MPFISISGGIATGKDSKASDPSRQSRCSALSLLDRQIFDALRLAFPSADPAQRPTDRLVSADHIDDVLKLRLLVRSPRALCALFLRNTRA